MTEKKMIKTGGVIFGALLAAASFGQAMDSFDAHVGNFQLLTNKGVQAEVGITTTQRNKMNDIVQKETMAARQYIDSARKAGKSDQAIAADPGYAHFQLELREKILGALSPPQLKRLREISLQFTNMSAIVDVIVSKRIGMTDAQLAKARKLFTEGATKENAIIKTINFALTAKFKDLRAKTKEEAQKLNAQYSEQRRAMLQAKKPEILRIEDQTAAQLQAVLTPKQLAAYRSLQGKKFDLSALKGK